MMRPGPWRRPDRTSLGGASAIETNSGLSTGCDVFPASSRLAPRDQEKGLLRDTVRTVLALQFGAACVEEDGRQPLRKLRRKVCVVFMALGELLRVDDGV